MSVRFSLPPAKKPIDRLAGDQNGYLAPSVPINGRASAESSDLSHSRGCPSPEATNASCLPSGESAKDIGSSVAGVTMSVRISGASGAVRKYGRPTATANASAKKSAAPIQVNVHRPWILGLALVLAGSFRTSS